jgi:hypothetical protein
MNNIKVLNIGEIVRINNKEYILILTNGGNGREKWEQPTLKILDNILEGINRKPFYKKMKIEMPKTRMTKTFKAKKLTRRIDLWKNKKITKPVIVKFKRHDGTIAKIKAMKTMTEPTKINYVKRSKK